MTREQCVERLLGVLPHERRSALCAMFTALDAIRDASDDGPQELAAALGLAAEVYSPTWSRKPKARIVRAKEKP